VPPLDYDPFIRAVAIDPEEEARPITVAELFSAGRGAPVTELEPALVLALSLAEYPHLIAQLGHVSHGTRHYIDDPRLRELTHRHLVAAIAAAGTLPTGWQTLAERLGSGLDAVSVPARLHAQAGIRTHLGSPSAIDARIFPNNSSPAQVIGEIALELAAPHTAIEQFPTWLGALGPLIRTPEAAAAVVQVFSRIPRGKQHPRH